MGAVNRGSRFVQLAFAAALLIALPPAVASAANGGGSVPDVNFGYQKPPPSSGGGSSSGSPAPAPAPAPASPAPSSAPAAPSSSPSSSGGSAPKAKRAKPKNQKKHKKQAKPTAVAPVAAPAVAPVPPVDDTGAGNGSAATIAIGLALALVAIAAGLALWRRRIASASPARPAAAGAGIATATTATLAGPATETRRGGAKPKRSRSAARRARRRRAAEPPAERPVADRGRPVAGLSSEALGTSIAAAGTGSKRRGSRKAHRAAERRGSGAGGQRERELIAHAATPLNGQGIGRVAVISRKGGVGKTTTTLMLGHMLAKHRLDRVLALDGNPDAGSLGFRVKRETDATVTELLAARDEIKRYADIRRFTNLAPSGLEVIAGDDDPRITNALREEDYRKITELLERHYNLLCMDTGTGVLESANRGIIQIADQVVVVMGSSVDSGRVASSTLDWLEQNGHSDLVSEAVAVINMGRGDGLVDVGKLAEHFGARCRAVVMVPWDPQLAAGAEAGIEDLAPETRLAYLELAAAVGVGFGRLAPAG